MDCVGNHYLLGLSLIIFKQRKIYYKLTLFTNFGEKIIKTSIPLFLGLLLLIRARARAVLSDFSYVY